MASAPLLEGIVRCLVFAVKDGGHVFWSRYGAERLVTAAKECLFKYPALFGHTSYEHVDEGLLVHLIGIHCLLALHVGHRVP